MLPTGRILGVHGIGVKYTDSNGNVTDRATPTSTGATFTVEIKNFGSVAGTSFTGIWRPFFGGEEGPVTQQRDTPITLYPTASAFLVGYLGQDKYTELIRGKTLVLEITVTYSGPSATYKECTKHQFDTTTGGFLQLGACDHPPNLKQ
jgi:hypothetical protein